MAVTSRHDDRLMHINCVPQKQASNVLAIQLPTEFTQAAVDELGPTLRRQVTDARWQEIRLDGRDVRSLTPSALGLLVSLAQLGATHAVRVVVIGASPQLAIGLAIGRLIDQIHLEHGSPGDVRHASDRSETVSMCASSKRAALR